MTDAEVRNVLRTWRNQIREAEKQVEALREGMRAVLRADTKTEALARKLWAIYVIHTEGEEEDSEGFIEELQADEDGFVDEHWWSLNLEEERDVWREVAAEMLGLLDED